MTNLKEELNKRGLYANISDNVVLYKKDSEEIFFSLPFAEFWEMSPKEFLDLIDKKL